MGRRKKTDSRTYQYRIRLSKDELTNLNRVSAVMGMPKSEVIRAALRLYTDVILWQN